MNIRRKISDKISTGWMLVSLLILMLLPLVIGLGLAAKSLPILGEHSLLQLLGTKDWSPREDRFGFLSFIIGSVWVTVLSFILSGPVCLLAALYLTQYARHWLLKSMRLVIDILAGIPSVVYGVWGVLVIVPFISEFLAPAAGHVSTGYCILAGGIVLAIMSIPYMLNMLIEVFRSIPIELKEASLTLGASYWETVKFVVLRQGFTGILAAFGLGISKALGETIAVLMVVGNVVRIPQNIFQADYPLPALIANNYGEMMSIPMYDAALMLAALILFVIILLFNGLTALLINKAEIR